MSRPVSEPLMSDQNPGPAVLENDSKLFGSKPEIQRHKDESEMSRCEIRLDEDVAIFMENGDTILSRKPQEAKPRQSLQTRSPNSR